MKTPVAIMMAAGLFGAGLLSGLLFNTPGSAPVKPPSQEVAAKAGALAAVTPSGRSEAQVEPGRKEATRESVAARLADVLHASRGQKRWLAIAKFADELERRPDS